MLAAQAPVLHAVLAKAQQDGAPYLSLDGTLISTDRLAERTEAGNHAWY